jgi:hypothetical protein
MFQKQDAAGIRGLQAMRRERVTEHRAYAVVAT